MSIKIDSVKKILREEKDAFMAVVKSLRTQLAVAEEDVSRVVTALNALEQKPAKKGVKKTSPTGPRVGKPCCTKKEVIAILSVLLRDNGALTRVELGDLAKDKLIHEHHKSLSGFAMRFKEALADAQFHETSPGTYELVLGQKPFAV